jgi:hypothetical protein
VGRRLSEVGFRFEVDSLLEFDLFCIFSIFFGFMIDDDDDDDDDDNL